MEMKLGNHPGDVLRALRHLSQRDADTRERVAKLLGFTWRRAVATPARKAENGQPTAARPEVRSKSRLLVEEPSLVGANDAWIDLRETAITGTPTWFAEIEALPPTIGNENLSELPMMPLLRPPWRRAILTAALGRGTADGDVDVERLAEQLARGEPVKKLCRRRRRRLIGGVQVFVDIHDAMCPFVHDQEELLGAIRDLLPSDFVEVVEHPGCPLGDQQSRLDYRPPQSGTLVMLLTDLGVGPLIAGRSRCRHWWRFSEALRRLSCPVVAFVPYAPERVPTYLKRCIAVLPWRPETTSGEVQRLVSRLDRRVSR